MQKLIIKLLLLTFVLFAVSVGVTAQDRTRADIFFEPGTGTVENVLNSRITFSRLTWTLDGTVTACSFRMEKSSDGITWEDLTTLQDCVVERRFEFITAPIGKFIRQNVTTLAGGGSVFIFWEGFRGDGCGIDYRGIFSVETSPDPAVGTEVSITVPSSEKWRVYSSLFELQADSTVVDREVFLTASEGSSEYFRVFADGVVKADQKGIFTAAPLGFVGTTGLGPSAIHQPADVRTIMIPIYSGAFIPGGHTLATNTEGLQVGDDYGPVAVLVERCPN